MHFRCCKSQSEQNHPGKQKVITTATMGEEDDAENAEEYLIPAGIATVREGFLEKELFEN